jgi:hypothetical protein
LNNEFRGIIIKKEITMKTAIFFPFHPTKILINTITAAQTISRPYVDKSTIKWSIIAECELKRTDEIPSSK